MKKFINDIKTWGIGFTIIGLMVAVIYFGYQIGKTVSYKLFYGSMVEESIKDVVKPECLIEDK